MIAESRRQTETPCGFGFEQEFRYVIPDAAIYSILAILTAVSTLRYGFIDTYAYKIMYHSARGDLDYVSSAPWGVEAGWLLLLYLLNFISESPKLMLFLSALFINGAFLYGIKKYSADVSFSVLIYFCLNFLDTNNGVRQFVAAGGVIFAFLRCLFPEKKNWLFFVLLVVLAAQFHRSAYVALPLALAVVGTPLNIRMVAALAVCLGYFLFPAEGAAILAGNMEGSKYQFYLAMTGGMGYPRAFIVGLLPLLLAFRYIYCCRRDGRKFAREDGCLVNLVLLNSVFVLLGLHMQYWARLCFYTSFALYILMPKLIYTSLGSGRGYPFMRFGAVICYLIFFAFNVGVNVLYGALEQFYLDL